MQSPTPLVLLNRSLGLWHNCVSLLQGKLWTNNSMRNRIINVLKSNCLMESLCISYSSIAMIKHHNWGNHRRKGLIWAYRLRGIELITIITGKCASKLWAQQKKQLKDCITNCNQKIERTNLKWWESLNTQNLPTEAYFLQQSHTSPSEQGTKYSDVQEYGDIWFTPLQSPQSPKISSEKLLLKYYSLYLSSQQSLLL